MTKKRRQVGLAGEQAARAYLEEQGYEIMEANYRCPLGEIDIVARDRGTIVLVEVRTRTGLSFGAPEESITAEKARRLRRLALYYLKSFQGKELPCRIDLVAVMLNRHNHALEKLNHIRGILEG